MIDRGAKFADAQLRVPPSECRPLAIDAVTFVWEECKFGRATCEDVGSFWALVSKRLYEIRNTWRIRHESLDAVKPGTDSLTGHDDPQKAYQPADQIDYCYLNEVRAGIELLPGKHASVMRRIAAGHNAVDIATELRVPVHTVFRLINQARDFLFARELIGMAKDSRRAH